MAGDHNRNVLIVFPLLYQPPHCIHFHSITASLVVDLSWCICLLNDLEVDDPSALNIDPIEDGCQSSSSMVAVAVDSDDKLLLHLLVIFRTGLPGGCDYSRDH